MTKRNWEPVAASLRRYLDKELMTSKVSDCGNSLQPGEIIYTLKALRQEVSMC